MILLAGFAVLLAVADAQFSSNSDVISLTQSNFDKLVLGSDNIWLVEFFAPWCGHCQNLAPKYDKAASALRGVVKVGAVNCDVEKELSRRFGITGFPQIKIFGADKNKPQQYNGDRTAKAIVLGALDAVKDKVMMALSGGSRTSDVVELGDNNFASRVYNSKDYWLIEFYSPGCGHCQRLAPEWAKAATELKGKVKVAAVDATVHHQVSNEFNIRAFPTMFWLEPGSRSRRDAYEYDGGRTASDIVNWALDRLLQNIAPPKVNQLVDENIFKESCEDTPLCVIAVLPHILDCQSECRNNYIKMLTSVGEKFKQKMWGWVWVEGGAQMDLEDSMDIGGFGYPALAALNNKKQAFSLLKGSFSESGINEFLRDLSYGRGRTSTIKGGKLPKIVKTEPWNGEDQALPEEEDIDLSDVVLDDIKEEL
ncbi:hypothetical protein RUM43_012337 [Polyplax serrata]|uniref:protein disulfide-isomerase n=1 Tax=Polyplax serrata TaxID=468196 RepID=A0AAN8NKI8_POLSC